MKKIVITLFSLLCLGQLAKGQIISTIAGTGIAGVSGEGGPATAAQLNLPSGVAIDGSGNVLIADDGNNRIRKINTSGIISTIAGTSTYGFSGDGGAATAAMLNGPTGIAVDSIGNIFFADFGNNRIRKINTSGIISTVAGNGLVDSFGVGFFTGDGGAATATTLYYPSDVAIDGSGNILIVDYGNIRIRKVNPSGIISTIAGNGTSFPGYFGPMPATDYSFVSVTGIAVDVSGNIFIADAGKNDILKINTSGIIREIAGGGYGGYGGGFNGDGGPATAARLNGPNSVMVDGSGNILIADVENHRIRKINTSGIISTIAGSGAIGGFGGFSGDGGAATGGRLNSPKYVATDGSGNIYISDWANNRIRRISACLDPIVAAIIGASGITIGSTVTLTDTTTGGSWSSSNTSLATVSNTGAVRGIAAGNVTISYTKTNACGTIYATHAVTVSIAPILIINTIAGISGSGYGSTGDGWWATEARLNSPKRIFVDGSGNKFIADYLNHRIRKINASGTISTIAGTGSQGFSGDGGVATAAELSWPSGIFVDGSGNVFISDQGNHRIRKINTSGIISTIAGTGTTAYSGDGGPATAAQLHSPRGITADLFGNIFIADNGNSCIRKINTLGIMSTVAGTGIAGYSGDGGTAMAAQLSSPKGIAIDSSGNLFIADCDNNRVRKINTSGIISTIAGTGSFGIFGFSGDGGPAAAAQLNSPSGVAVDGSGNVFIADNSNHRIRKINTSGIISTIAGSGPGGGLNGDFSGDGGAATAARLNFATDVALDNSGNIFIADENNNRIRKVSVGTSCPLPVVAAISGGATPISIGGTTILTETTTGGSWTSGTTSIATVSSAGKVTAVATGSAVITYTKTNSCGSAFATRNIIVGTNHTPTIVHGNTPQINICSTYGAWNLSNNLQAGDLDTAQTLNWSLVSAPHHGSANAAYSAPSTAGTITPTGLFYTADSGYTGRDTFSVSITDGIDTIIASIRTNILASPAAPMVSGASTVCIGSATTLTCSPAGGRWNASAGFASINTTGVVTGLHTGLTAVNYTSPANSNGCTNKALYPITVITTASPGSVLGGSLVCPGAIITLTGSVPGGTWISASPGIATIDAGGMVTGVSSGTASISYNISNSCGTATARKSVVVSSPPVPSAIAGSSNILHAGNIITLSDATTGGTWSSVAPATAAISPTGVVTALTSGTTTISYTVTNSCGQHGAATRVVIIAAARDSNNNSGSTLKDDAQEIKIYPNPNSGNFTIELSTNTGNAIVQILDMNGKEVATKTTPECKLTFDLQALPKGIYMLLINSGDKDYREKIVVE